MKLNALKRVAVCDGSDDIERWIDRLEFAIKIDDVPDDHKGAVFSSHLDGPAYDVWKGMDSTEQEDPEKIKAALREVFGLRRMDAWLKASAPVMLAPGDSVDVAFQELKRHIKTTTDGADPVSQIASCILLQRLPTPAVRDQVLLRCGDTLEPTEVLRCSKQLLSNTTRSDAYVTLRPVMAAAKGRGHGKEETGSFRCGGCGRSGHQQEQCRVKCFRCSRVAHIARFCTSQRTTPIQRPTPAVSGNGELGQPLV